MDRKRRFSVNAIIAGGLAVGAVWALGLAVPAAQERGVRLVKDEATQRVDVTIDGQPFTSYLYPSTQKKPVLFPLRSARGTPVTRGLPTRAPRW